MSPANQPLRAMEQQLPLKDIHLPDSIGWWPPAPGWWLLPILLALLAIAIRLVYRRLTRRTPAKSAQKLLLNLSRCHSDNPIQTVAQLSALLRRAALSLDSRGEVAGLRGEAWLDYLDSFLPDAPFRQGVGRCLADAHYRPTAPDDIDIDALFALCERWLNRREKQS